MHAARVQMRKALPQPLLRPRYRVVQVYRAPLLHPVFFVQLDFGSNPVRIVEVTGDTVTVDR